MLVQVTAPYCCREGEHHTNLYHTAAKCKRTRGDVPFRGTSLGSTEAPPQVLYFKELSTSASAFKDKENKALPGKHQVFSHM